MAVTIVTTVLAALARCTPKKKQRASLSRTTDIEASGLIGAHPAKF